MRGSPERLAVGAPGAATAEHGAPPVRCVLREFLQRSGDRRVPRENRLLVYASQGGSRDHPDWYKNLVADPHVGVEAGDETYEATAHPLEGAERDRLWAENVRRRPQFGEYEAKATPRVIPVVALVRA